MIGMSIPEDVSVLLACPRCKGKLKEQGMFSTCAKCSLAYPVLEGKIPDMLPDDAWPLDKAKKAGFRHKLKP